MTPVFIHPQALCETREVGPGTRIWAFAHVLPGARIGADCNICDGVFIENDVVVGDRVTVKCGVQLWDGIVVEDDVFIGPNATFTNDPFPRSKVYPKTFGKILIRRGASIGANATILPGVELGAQAMVGAGAVVTQSVPANTIVAGNPAQITGYVDRGRGTMPEQPAAAPGPDEEAGSVELGIGRASKHRLRLVQDIRGDLTVGEFERDIPFAPKRYFAVFNVPTREVRGEHAHKQCHQYFVCLRGSCRLHLDDGTHRATLLLDRPDVGIYVPPRIWTSQFRHSADALLIVFASHPYDPEDYIRDYEAFLSWIRSMP
jgi:UDP-2-acetamido-3-amino-2,3-dideoxy-glucuronate N-acetyltransferase